MKTKQSLFRRKTLRLLLLFTLILSSITYGQNTGTITGTVYDSTSGEYLPGAHVILSGTNFKIVTNDFGKYVFNNVPAGTYTLKTIYLGLEDFSMEITVPESGGKVVQDIEMVSGYEILNEVTIKGNRFGQSKALNIQKESDNIKNVISKEQIERFPDLNTAEVLQRVPGVTIQRSNGEGRFIALRGTNPSLTNVTINGQEIAMSNGSARVVELDVISASQLGGLEVTKVVTPNMDGNAIGGSVNLKTRSAFEYSKRQLGVVIGGGKNMLSNDLGFRSDVSYSNKLGKNDNVGISLGANFTRTNRESHSNEQKWGDREDVNDNNIELALRDVQLKESVNQRDRFGLSGQLEFKLSDKSRIYVNAMFNKRWDAQTRNEFRARVDKGDYLSANTVEGARFVKSVQDRVEEQVVNAYNFGGESQFSKLKMDYQLSFSNAYTKKPDGQIVPEFQMKKVDLLLTDLDSQTPNFNVTNGAEIYNGINYEFDGTDYRFEDTENKLYAATLDFSLPMNFGSNSGEFKFGGKYKSNKKDRNDKRSKYKWEGDDLLASQFESDRIINNFQDTYSMGNALDADKFRNFFLENQGPDKFEKQDRPDVNFGEPYDATENTTGLYIMGTQTIKNLLILAGVRVEFTNTDYTGNDLVLDDGDFVSASENNVKRDYSNIFPNLQFRYRVTPNTNIRLAYSRGIAPPNFFDLVPYSITDIDGEEIIRGNGNLDPTTSNNYDLLGEHFFQGIGILSGGLFIKDMDKFIFTSVGIENGGIYDGYDFEEPVNGAGAKLFGVELSWQQQFTFLPGFLSGFGIYTNYTYTHSSNIDLGPNTTRTDINVLPQQVANVGNVALSYEKNGLNARIAANMTGKFLDEVGADSERDEWRDSYTQWDFSASQRFLKEFDIFFEWNNIFNKGEYNYIGRTSRSRAYELNGTSVNIGLKWSPK